MDDTIKGLKHIADLLDGRTTLSSVNNEGLNKATAEEFLRESVQLDVDEIDARGIGNDGEKLKLDNDDLLIEVDVGTDLPTTVSKVQAMLARLQNVRNK